MWFRGNAENGKIRLALLRYLLTNTDNTNEGIIRVDVEVLPEERKLSEFGTKAEADAFAESAAIAFQTAGMMVVYDPD